MTVLRRAYVEVEPDVSDFDKLLREKFQKQDPGGKAGKQLGGQLNRALKRLDLDPVDVRADPKKALAGIAATEAKLRALSNQASTVEIKVRAEQGLRELQRFRKQIGDVGEDSATGFFARFHAKVGPLVAGMPISGPVMGVFAAVGAGAAPVFLSAFASALSAGAGTAIIGVGLAGVVSDPAVAKRGTQVGRKFTTAVQQEAAGAFRGPVLESLDDLDQAGQRIARRLGAAFRQLGPDIAPFTGQLARAAESLTDDLAGAAERSGPALRGLGGTINILTDGVGDFVNIVADGGPEAAANLQLVTGALTDLLRTSGQTINLANKLSSNPWLTGPLIPLLRKHYGEAGEAAETAGDKTRYYAKVTEDSAGATALATTKLRDFRTELQQVIDRNLSAAEANISLRAAVKDAAEAVDKKRRVSDAEHTALIGMARAANTATQAADEQGRTVKEATAAHESNRKKLIETARAMGFSKTEAAKLANQYLAIPKGVNTKVTQPGMPNAQSQMAKYAKQHLEIAKELRTRVTVTGDNTAKGKLASLLVRQQALAKGISVSAAASAFNKQVATGAYHGGGWTGPGATMDEAGIVHADEHVIKKSSRRALEAAKPGALDYMNTTGRWPGYDAGGRVINAPFKVNAAVTKIISLEEALSKVTPAVPRGSTAPFMERLLESRFGMRMISGFRAGSRTLSGNLSYHALNRAVDFPPSEAMARYMYGNYKGRLKEAITPYPQWNVLNGRDHRYTGAVWRQHNFAGGNAHNHFAMDDGGFRVLQPGMNAVLNGTGKPEPIAGPNAMAAMAGSTYNINVTVPATAHPAETGRQVVLAIQAYERGNGNRWRTP